MKTRILLAASSLCICASLAAGGQFDKPKNTRAADRTAETTARAVEEIFGEGDRTLIRRYFADNHQNLPPGLAKRGGDLPPGLERQLRRKGHLPPGLEKQLHAFPDDLERRLPRLGEGLERGVIGSKAVLLNRATNLILDAFEIY
ncbi:MAG: hypothetical protein JXP48_02680 [Acidobacteria bacterium]|nr:hypothetical protein [Acidobacteriota bacterium]